MTLGIDSSTQSCSAVVIDPARGTIVAEASVHFGSDLPEYRSPQGFLSPPEPGVVHSDPLMWVDALELLFERLQEKCDLSSITTISGAGQQHGSVYLNEQWPGVVASLVPSRRFSGQLAPCLSRRTSPIWMDTSTGTECVEIAAAVGGPQVVCEKSGSVPIERFTGPQIRRFFKSDPVKYAATSRIHLVSSFLCSILIGGDAPLDTGDGAGMNLLNLGTMQWDQELLSATAPGLEDKLPNVKAGTTPAGDLAPCFKEKFGFAPGTRVLVWTGDNPSSLVGTGASRPGKVVISLGTSDTFFGAVPDALHDPEGCGHVFGNPTGGWMTLQCFLNGSLAREKVRDRLRMDWAAFSHALASTPPGNRGRLMVPFFGPEISPQMRLSAPILHGTPGFMDWKEPAAAVRACIEGQFVNMRLRSEWMRLDTRTILLTGGASRNDAIARVVADVFQAEVRRLAVSGSVALGAALRAAVLDGHELDALEARFCSPEDALITPDPSSASVYQEAMEIFSSLIS